MSALVAPTEQELQTIRQCVLDANVDLSMRQRKAEKNYDDAAIQAIDQALKAKGVSLAKFYPGTPTGEALMYLFDWRARAKKSTHGDGSAVLPLERLEANAKNAMRFKIGNCVECASLAFCMLMEYGGANGDAALPDLPAAPANRPMVEKAKVSNPGDHHFVLINRNPSIAIADLSWMDNPDVIICDPWWFTDDGGDAHFIASRKAKDVRDEIRANKAGLAVDLALPLGSGHSTRFADKHAGTYWSS